MVWKKRFHIQIYVISFHFIECIKESIPSSLNIYITCHILIKLLFNLSSQCGVRQVVWQRDLPSCAPTFWQIVFVWKARHDDQETAYPWILMMQKARVNQCCCYGWNPQWNYTKNHCFSVFFIFLSTIFRLVKGSMDTYHRFCGLPLLSGNNNRNTRLSHRLGHKRNNSTFTTLHQQSSTFYKTAF